LLLGATAPVIGSPVADEQNVTYVRRTRVRTHHGIGPGKGALIGGGGGAVIGALAGGGKGAAIGGAIGAGAGALTGKAIAHRRHERVRRSYDRR
jgi:hypothetical protein